MGYLRRFMAGRYGTDPLTLFLLAVYLLLYLIGSFSGWVVLIGLAFLVFAVTLWRTLSRQVDRRRAENTRFLRLFAPLIRRYRTRRTMQRDRDHCYFKCPGCGQRLRAPKGKGRIQVTCRSCGACFEEKS